MAVSKPKPELGKSGLNISSNGQVDDEFLTALKGPKKFKTFREMRDNNSIIGASVLAYEAFARQVEWTAEPHPDGTVEDAKFLASVMDDMSHSWGDVIAEAMQMIVYGYAPCEIVYKERLGPREKNPSKRSQFNDGKIGLRKIALRSPDTIDHWEFDDEGGIQGLVQKAPPENVEVEIPIEQLLLFRTTNHKNNPEGRSMLRSAFEPWFYLKRVRQLQGTGIERDLAGYPVVRLPLEYLAADAPDGMKATVRVFEQMLSDIRRDSSEGLVLPSDTDDQGNYLFDLTLMSSGSARQHDLGTVQQELKQEIAMAMLSDFILLGHENVGSHALSSDKTNTFAVLVGMLLGLIADVLNRHLVPRLWEMNGWEPVNLPRIVFGDIETPELGQLANYVSSLNGAGVPLLPDSNVAAYLRKVTNLPAMTPEAQQEIDKQVEFGTEQANLQRQVALADLRSQVAALEAEIPDDEVVEGEVVADEGVTEDEAPVEGEIEEQG